MASYNKVILIGTLTRDPEMRYTRKGTAIAKICLAMNRTWKGEDGSKHDEVTFVDVDCFGKQAETVSQYLKKGRPVLVEGRLKLDQWEDNQTGQKRSRLGVAMESFQFLGRKSESGGGSKVSDVPSPAPRPAPAEADGETDTVPF